MKKTIKFRIAFILVMILLVTIGLTRVNIINTKALSPLDSTNDNYEKVSEAFGEDFSNFIKDDANIKVYKDNSDEILVKVGNKDFKITNESNIINKAENVAEDIGSFFISIKDKVEKVMK